MTTPANTTNALLEVATLACVRGERRLFSSIDFSVSSREVLYLRGENGSGKTSLLRILCGLAHPSEGEVRWRGKPIGELGEEFRHELCYLGHHNALKEELTPLENLLTSARLADEALDEDQALHALGKFGLAGREDLPCRYLSQGQKRRVALARLINERRTLWILDEPFVSLDAAGLALLTELLAEQLRRGGLIILTTHQAIDIPAATVRELCLD